MSQTERAIDAGELDAEFEVDVFDDQAPDDQALEDHVETDGLDEAEDHHDPDERVDDLTGSDDEQSDTVESDDTGITAGGDHSDEPADASTTDDDRAASSVEALDFVDEIEQIDDADDLDDIDDSYELPEIQMATEDDDGDVIEPGADPLIARRLPGKPAPEAEPQVDEPEVDDPEVSDDVLEELRQADIDGPTVALAPQDDTSSGIRRPKRSPEYDPAPFPIPIKVPRVLGRKPRVRRVTRVVRHVDPWSVFKIAIIANLVMYVIVLTAGVLLWNVAHATGTVDNVERFFESFGWSTFEFQGGEIFHNAWIGGLFLLIGFTGLAVLFATLFNLITDLVGGMRFTVLEEEVVESRTSPMRRFVVRRAEPEVPAVTYDESGPIIREGVVDDSGSIAR